MLCYVAGTNKPSLPHFTDFLILTALFYVLHTSNFTINADIWLIFGSILTESWGLRIPPAHTPAACQAESMSLNALLWLFIFFQVLAKQDSRESLAWPRVVPPQLDKLLLFTISLLLH